MGVKYDAISLTTMLLMLMLRLPGEVRGDYCSDKQTDCSMKITAEMSKVGRYLQQNPPHIPAALNECGLIEKMLRGCERELRAVCSSAATNSTMGELNTAHMSMCGQETMCSYRLSLCQQDFTVMGEVAAAMQQRPPDVAFVLQVCRQLNGSVIECVENLKPDCGNMPNFTSSAASLTSVIIGICGAEALCNLQMAECQYPIQNLNAGRNDQVDVVKMCKAQQEARSCMNQKLDPDCLSLPQVSSAPGALNSSLSMACTGEAARCPQVWQCMNARQSRDDCSGHSGLVGCVADLKGTCELTEEAITFKAVEALSMQFCTELQKSKGGEANCSSLGVCMMGSQLARKMYGGGSSSQLHISLLLDSRTWCQYLYVIADCYIGSADKCQLDASLLSYMTHQHEHLSTVCPLSSSYGEKQAASNLIFILLVAIFTAWGRRCLH